MQHRLGLTNEDADVLRRAAFLHEIGLAISHSGYHRHSAYLLEHSDVPGFSQVDQLRMAQLVQNHRRKLKSDAHEQAKMIGGDNLVYLCLLLRLAVLVHHSRSDHNGANIQLSVTDDERWRVQVAADGEHVPLLLSDLADEKDQFDKWDVKLVIDA